MKPAKKSITPGFWKEHLLACEASGLTQREYCECEGLSINSFVYQNGRQRKQAKPPVMPFIKASASLKGTGFEILGLQLILPNGIRIAIGNEVNASLLQTVLSIAGGQ